MRVGVADPDNKQGGTATEPLSCPPDSGHPQPVLATLPRPGALWPLPERRRPDARTYTLIGTETAPEQRPVAGLAERDRPHPQIRVGGVPLLAVPGRPRCPSVVSR